MNAFEDPSTRTLNVDGNQINYVKGSRQGHGGSTPGEFGSEFSGLGFLGESSGRCSVKDSPAIQGCNYAQTLTNNDRQWMALDAHYTGIAQLNGFNPWVDPVNLPQGAVSSVNQASLDAIYDQKDF